MSERVLHEWEFNGQPWSVKETGAVVIFCLDGSPFPPDCVADVIVLELARLSARVAELEAENAKLRACVEAADEIDWLCSDDGILIRREGDIIEYIDGWRSAVRKYRAARAEVDK